MRKGLVFLLVVWGILTAAAPVWAQVRPAPLPAPPASSPSADPQKSLAQSLAAAKAAQAKAAQLFRENQFAEAADLLRTSYQDDPRPILLFNAGQAYRKAERAAEAKAMYEQFLTVVPEHPLALETRGYLKDMEAFLAMQQRAKLVALALEEQLAETQTSKQQTALALEQERLRSLRIQAALLQTQEQAARDHKKLVSRRRWIVGLAVGTGAVAAIVGISVGLFFNARASTDGGTVMIAK